MNGLRYMHKVIANETKIVTTIIVIGRYCLYVPTKRKA